MPFWVPMVFPVIRELLQMLLPTKRRTPCLVSVGKSYNNSISVRKAVQFLLSAKSRWLIMPKLFVGIRCEIARVDWANEKPKQGHVQEAARAVRYQQFQRICNQYQMNVLLVAHHVDDQ
ncbi:hypothetical protein POM88_005524 [Heracleum sosnowskyi]|uniref:tRNA(Ile)-lysidine/2-thiocytidine synthase N-terminal domain-containing protein n=1 Tax=Heracleum sosnowskyi TaxID=360622 RepID=A0AAD8J1M6_9APIA|nr:hypothetical protein POM88_005524 [Heracleum sosnowskyi]